jgi:hypothetical protein
VSGFRLYWAHNDGMTGHIFLDPIQMEGLLREMAMQGMALSFAGIGDRPQLRITVKELEEALEAASPDPIELDDERLWLDWLRFLEQAAENGGLVVKT